MLEKFIFWVESIFEDDPLPDEISIIVFNTIKNGKYKYLELRGYEKPLSFNNIFFRPLEAECFYCNDLARLKDDLFKVRVKWLIEECFVSKMLKYELKNVEIYFNFDENLEFLFVVNNS